MVSETIFPAFNKMGYGTRKDDAAVTPDFPDDLREREGHPVTESARAPSYILSSEVQKAA